MSSYTLSLLPAFFIALFQYKRIWKPLDKKYNPIDTVLQKYSYNLFEILIWGIAKYLTIFLFLFQIFIPLFSITNNFQFVLLLKFIGYTLILSGFIISLLSIKALGNNWTGCLRFRIKKNQQLITTCIYKYIRHPIYLVIIIESLGYELVTNSWLLIPTFIISSLLINWQIKREEKLLLDYFQDQYRHYQSKTGSLFLKF